MIHINRKQDCCGCRSCVQRCPRKCISFVIDDEGFAYPKVDMAHCVDCHLCEKVCPVINQSDSIEPVSVYAAFNKDEEVRLKSSSGGVFSALADCVLEKKGVVFGACFNEKWEVVHDYTEDKEGLEKFRGSKYVQSDIGETYKQAENFLKAGRLVLFSGTPCQIAGLRKFLRKDYVNLLAVDVICHGAPSPMVFEKYLQEEKQNVSVGNGNNSVSSRPVHYVSGNDVQNEKVESLLIQHIDFRDKRTGWKKFSFTLDFAKALINGDKNTVSFTSVFAQNPFMKGFLKNIYLRPSCYHCPSKHFTSGSDITLGDLWGADQIVPEMDDDKGLSAVIINSNKGKSYFDQLLLKKINVNLSSVVKYNSMIYSSVKEPEGRSSFFKNKNLLVHDRIDKYTRESKRNYNIINDIIYRIKVVIWNIIHPNTN